MHRARFVFLACLVFSVSPPTVGVAADTAGPQSLLIQSAKKQARECLERGEYGSAVRILEAYLGRIDGDAAYLALLEQAYRGYVAECRQKGLTGLADKYTERLAILDPAVAKTTAVSLPIAPDTGKPAVPLPGPTPTLTAAESVQRGDEAFAARRYAEASRHYEQAARAGHGLSQPCKERWAYCKLHHVTDRLNQGETGADLGQLETEVRTALGLAPTLEYGRQLLAAIEERSLPRGVHGLVPIQHHPERYQGWLVAESQNFRVFAQDAKLAGEVLQRAERLRLEVAWRWLRVDGLAPWTPKCDIFLHPTAQGYARATGVSAELPGHASIGAERRDASRVHTRRIDLRLDEPTAMHAVLPHELTHVVLAGHYGSKPIPRWADEGMALLSEPADRVQHYRLVAARAAGEGRAYPLEQLLVLENYPSSQAVHIFYGQSVTLVEWLVLQKGHRAFTEFLREAQRDGVEPALARHYGLCDFKDLHQRWLEFVRASLPQGSSSAGARRTSGE